MNKSVVVRTPDGQFRSAELTSGTRNGYRSARVSINGNRVRGRVSARHGFTDGRTLNFEVLAEDALYFFGQNDYVVKA